MLTPVEISTALQEACLHHMALFLAEKSGDRATSAVWVTKLFNCSSALKSEKILQFRFIQVQSYNKLFLILEKNIKKSAS